MLFAILLHSLLLALLNCVEADPHNNHKHKHDARHDDSQQQQHDHENIKREYWGGPDTPGVYDYIVIGSGAGGAPNACRLARAGYSVLLIEAGDDQGERLEAKVPTWHLQAAEVPEMKWDYFVTQYSDPVQQARNPKMNYLCPDRSIYTGLSPPWGCQPLGVLYPRAGTMGGCTQHHSEIHIYPWEADWEHLEELTGNWTWGPDSMRSYFVKMERNQHLPSSVVGHGYDGWLSMTVTSLSVVAEDPKITSLVIAAATALGKGLLGGLVGGLVNLGHILATDFNAPGKTRDEDENVWQVPIGVDPRTSTRSGPRTFIYDTINQGYPLHFQPYTFATKILFDTSGYRPRAYGVQYEVGQYLYSASPLSPGYLNGGVRGAPGYAYARREVILSAGAFESPKLLMLSGIGDCTQLAYFGIPCLVNLPGVGGNMQDRYEVSITGYTPTPFPVVQDCKWSYSYPDPCLDRWLAGTTPIDKGVYGSNGLALAITLKSSVDDSPIPDLYISGAPAKFTGYFPRFAEDTFADPNHWIWLVLKARAKNNAGYVRLRSTNPMDVPEINFNSFAIGGDSDVQAIVDGIAYARKAFAEVIPIDGGFTEDIPGLNVQGPDLAQFIKDVAWGHHATGTCAIGRPDDPWAVLDGDFRVYGVDGLRVADLSIFPKIPGFFVAIPTYMISEKAADAILGQTPNPNTNFPDAGGLFGTLGYGLVGGVTQGASNPEGVLGSSAGLFGGLGPFDNNQPILRRDQDMSQPLPKRDYVNPHPARKHSEDTESVQKRAGGLVGQAWNDAKYRLASMIKK